MTTMQRQLLPRANATLYRIATTASANATFKQPATTMTLYIATMLLQLQLLLLRA